MTKPATTAIFQSPLFGKKTQSFFKILSFKDIAHTIKVVTGNPCYPIWPIHASILSWCILSFKKSYPACILPEKKLIFLYPVSLSFLFWNIPSPKSLRKMSVPTQNLLQKVLSVPVKTTVLTSSLWIIWLSNLDLVYQVTGQIFNLWKNLSFGKKLDLTYLCLGHKKSHLFETLLVPLILTYLLT